MQGWLYYVHYRFRFQNKPYYVHPRVPMYAVKPIVHAVTPSMYVVKVIMYAVTCRFK